MNLHCNWINQTYFILDFCGYNVIFWSFPLFCLKGWFLLCSFALLKNKLVINLGFVSFCGSIFCFLVGGEDSSAQSRICLFPKLDFSGEAGTK